MLDSRPAPDRAQLEALLALLLVEGMGDVRLDAFLDGRAPLDALREGFPGGIRPEGFPKAVAERVLKADPARGAALLKQCEAQGIHVIGPCADTPFPPSMDALPDPPALLFARGNLALLDAPALTIVGSRAATAYGRTCARMAAGEAARIGLVVWSGLARGIDGEAHRACLEAGGKTVAVLGTGVDVIYPREHERLAAEILEKDGLLLSEFLPGTTPRPGNFPRRNRFLAGLTWATLVVEASERSGSLITARLAVEMGREVMAIPHPITSRVGVGPNTLIQMGASLIQSGRDLLRALPEPLRKQLPAAADADSTAAAAGEAARDAAALPADQRTVLLAIPPGEVRLPDELVADTELPTPAVLSALLALELDGWVRPVGGRYERVRG